jgi:hypothetical protein
MPLRGKTIKIKRAKVKKQKIATHRREQLLLKY